MDDNISFNISDQVSIIGAKEKHRFDFEGSVLNLNQNMSQNKFADKSNISNFMSIPKRNDHKNSSIFISNGVIEEWAQKKEQPVTKSSDNILDSLNKSHK